MQQADLFSSTPRARHRDPATSHLAAAKVVGRADAHRQMIAAAIRQRPGMTYREIAELTGLEPVAVGRRLVEVEREGLARAGEARTVNRSAMRTWWPR